MQLCNTITYLEVREVTHPFLQQTPTLGFWQQTKHLKSTWEPFCFTFSSRQTRRLMEKIIPSVWFGSAPPCPPSRTCPLNLQQGGIKRHSNEMPPQPAPHLAPAFHEKEPAATDSRVARKLFLLILYSGSVGESRNINQLLNRRYHLSLLKKVWVLCEVFWAFPESRYRDPNRFFSYITVKNISHFPTVENSVIVHLNKLFWAH